MENSSQLVLEISSDEEVGFGEPRKVGGYGVGGGGFGDRDDCNWLSELLDEVGGNDDSDDVVLVGETFANHPKKSRFELLMPSSETVDDDDACIVLDGDPDKPVVAAAAAADCSVGDGGDDVEIVGEKGEVACRDFPHARHLCVKFLFASTPHASHCIQCHCYVCDSLAPCSQWGTGVSSIDHCHATDKEEYWKTERKRIKNGNKPAPAVIPSSIPNTSHLQAFFQPTTQASSLAPQLSKSQFPQSPILRPVTAHLSSGPNPARPIPVIRAPRSKLSHILKQPGIVGASSPSNSHLSSGPNPARPIPVIRAPRSKLSNILKRPGIVGASSPSNSHLHGPHLPTNPLKRCRTLQQTPVSTRQRNIGTRTVRPVQQVSSSQSVNNVGHANYLHPPQPHFRPYVNTTNFVSTAAHLQPHVTPQPSVFRPKTYVPSQNDIGSELNSRFMIPSNQSAGKNKLANRSSQPQARGNLNSSLLDTRNKIQKVKNQVLRLRSNLNSSSFDMRNDIQKVTNHAQNGINENTNDFSLAWDYSSLIPGNVQVQEVVRQSQSAVPVDNSQVQSVVEPVVGNNYQQQGVDSNGGCQFLESVPNGTFDFLFENNSLLGVSEVPVSPLSIAYSPEPASVDTGNLFDL